MTKALRETLWIRLAAAADAASPLPWARLDGAGRVLERGVATTPAELARRCATGIVCKAVVGAERLLWTRLAMPGGRALRGPPLAYALEDRLVDAPEAVHAVAGRVEGDGRAPVAVVDRAWFGELLGILAEAGVRPQCALAEPALLDAAPGIWRLAWTEQPFLVTDAGAMQLAAQWEATAELIRLALAQAMPRPVRLELHCAPGRAPAELGDPEPGIEWIGGPTYDWAVAAQQAGGQPVDLLQGDFQRGPRLPGDRRAWRPVAWLAAALLLANGLGYLASLGLQAWEARQLRAAQRALFSGAFPEAKAVVDPLLQMRRQLAELRHRAGEPDGGDFLILLARAGTVLPSAARGGVRELRYGAGRLTLTVPVAGPDAAAWTRAGLKAEPRPAGTAGWTELSLEARP